MYARQAAALYLCAVVCAVLFVVLAALVTSGVTAGFDEAVRNGIHARASNDLTVAAQTLTLVGSARVWVPESAIAIVALWIAGSRRRAVGLVTVMVGAVLLDNGLKLAFHRVRPEPFFGVAPDTFSFPSGHALFAICLYGALAMIFASRLRRPAARIAMSIGAGVLVGAIGISRIYLGVHDPTDVLAGFLGGGAWLSLALGLTILRPDA
jgi:undecaprenyl-diphosphatase